MKESFVDVLSVGGKSNSLGRAHEVVEAVLHNETRLEELYQCMFDENSWTRMRAADSLEKVCRVHPEWLTSYIDRLQKDFAGTAQPSIQWHIAQIYQQVDLMPAQKEIAIHWLKDLLSTADVDWIVAANSMDTLAQFVLDGSVASTDFKQLLAVQLNHKSPAVVKRANKYLNQIK